MKIEFPDWQTNCQALLFDLDGTLIDSTTCIKRAWETWSNKHGMDADWVTHSSHGRRAADSLKLLLPDGDHEHEIQFLENLECELVEGLIAYDDAARLLLALDEAKWAIVTSGSVRLATHRLTATNLKTPNIMVCGDQITEGKPHPEGYLAAAKKLNVAPKDCVVVEDAVAGIRAGKAAGMKVIAVTTTHKKEELGEADYVCQSLTQLANAITP